MRKFKYNPKSNNVLNEYDQSIIYNEYDSISPIDNTIIEMVNIYPNDWDEIFDNTQSNNNNMLITFNQIKNYINHNPIVLFNEDVDINIARTFRVAKLIGASIDPNNIDNYNITVYNNEFVFNKIKTINANQFKLKLYNLSKLNQFIVDLYFTPINELINIYSDISGFNNSYRKNITWFKYNDSNVYIIVDKINEKIILTLDFNDYNSLPHWVTNKLFEWNFWLYNDNNYINYI